jgi:SAM-dependent methyltransferase
MSFECSSALRTFRFFNKHKPPQMILHKLIAHYLKRDLYAENFYILQARDAIRWMQKSGVRLGPGVTAVDAGCGHGFFGIELQKLGCEVLFSDEERHPVLGERPFKPLNLEKQSLAELGRFDLIICSNVLEHLSNPKQFLRTIPDALTPTGTLYLSWTNWLSPWGGHEFSPFHYLGPRRGHLLYDRVKKVKRYHTPYENLFPTYIGDILSHIKRDGRLEAVRAAPRYYTELAPIMAIPVIREFLAWNCALLIKLRRHDR